MKTVLVLGGFGFLGTNIIKMIDDSFAQSYQVVVLDRLLTHPSGERFNCVKKVYVGDFSDESLLKSIFKENDIDLVIHSLSTTIPLGTNNARFDIETNLVPTIKLLDSMLEHRVDDIVFISSGGAIYGNSYGGAHKENENTFPISSYGVVKLTVEKFMMHYAAYYGLKPLVLRLSNPYGPYHYSMKQGLINVALATALGNERFVVWGDGTAEKDYIYVRDFVSVMFQLVEKGIHSEVINVGSGQVASVNRILGEIKQMVPSFSWEYKDASKLDVSHFELDTTLLSSYIGTYDFVKLDEGVKMTYEWQKQLI
jgi:UDP-glucose 4-epimerase